MAGVEKHAFSYTAIMQTTCFLPKGSKEKKSGGLYTSGCPPLAIDGPGWGRPLRPLHGHPGADLPGGGPVPHTCPTHAPRVTLHPIHHACGGGEGISSAAVRAVPPLPL
jgi:hypothetical protein